MDTRDGYHIIYAHRSPGEALAEDMLISGICSRIEFIMKRSDLLDGTTHLSWHLHAIKSGCVSRTKLVSMAREIAFIRDGNRVAESITHESLQNLQVVWGHVMRGPSFAVGPALGTLRGEKGVRDDCKRGLKDRNCTMQTLDITKV